MTDAAAVQPDRPIDDAPGARDRNLDIGAARVFAEPVTVGDTVMITAAVLQRAGRFGPARGRPVAVIEAGSDGVRVHHFVDARRIGLALLAAALIVWRAGARR
jgi:hypothetical protein